MSHWRLLEKTPKLRRRTADGSTAMGAGFVPPSSHLHLNGYGDKLYATWICPPPPQCPGRLGSQGKQYSTSARRSLCRRRHSTDAAWPTPAQLPTRWVRNRGLGGHRTQPSHPSAAHLSPFPALSSKVGPQPWAPAICCSPLPQAINTQHSHAWLMTELSPGACDDLSSMLHTNGHPLLTCAFCLKQDW